MAKPCTPQCNPQAEQFFEIETANVGGRGALPSRSLGVPKGIFSFAKENIPFDSCSAKGAARVKGDILFRKREYPLWNPKRKTLYCQIAA